MSSDQDVDLPLCLLPRRLSRFASFSFSLFLTPPEGELDLGLRLATWMSFNRWSQAPRAVGKCPPTHTPYMG